MKKLLVFSFVLVTSILLFGSGVAHAFSCNQSRMVGGASDDCFSVVTVASNETTLVSLGTVLVYDVFNIEGTVARASNQVRVSAASTDGIHVAGIAQGTIASGNTALVMVRGRSVVALSDTDTVASGDALFVGASGDVGVTTSTTQTQPAFALDSQTAASGTQTRATIEAYITIV